MYKIVIFTGGETCDHYKGNHWLNSSSIDFVIAADSGFENALKFDKTPNLVIGDFDSTSKSYVAEYFRERNIEIDFEENAEGFFYYEKSENNCKIQSWPKDKDFSDTELALIEAKNYELAQRATNCFNEKSNLFTILVGGDGGRLDHLFGILNNYKTNNYPNIWLGKEQAIIALDSDSNFSNLDIYNLNENSNISVFPVFIDKFQSNQYEIDSINLKWELKSVNWTKNQISLSNRIEKIENQKVSICANYGRFLIFVPLYAFVKMEKYTNKL